MRKSVILSVTALFAVSFNSLAINNFSLHSRDISGDTPLTQRQVFNGFGCNGANMSPQLSWDNVPKDTKSFAVTVYDPDAPTGSGWWHWTVVNLPATAQHLPANAGNQQHPQLPAGAVQGRNDYGYAGFGGACPPPRSLPIATNLPSGPLKVIDYR